MFHGTWYKVPLMSYFTRHLDGVDERYLTHARHALGFSAYLFLGGVVCLVHAVLPFLFERSGSDIIRRLNDRMVVNRHRLTPATPSAMGTEPEPTAGQH